MPTYTLKLEPGESIILPASAKIKTIATTGDAELSSSCGDLPEPEEKACYYFDIGRDRDSNDAYNRPLIVSIKIGGTTYEYSPGVRTWSGLGYGIDQVYNTIASGIPPAIFEFIGYSVSVVTDREIRRMYVRTLVSVADSVLIKLVDDQNPGTLGQQTYYQILIPSEECDPSDTPSQLESD